MRRAELLLGKLETRAPVIGTVLDLAGGASWLGPALLTLAFMLGLSTAALEGRGRIDLLSFPLLGLVCWNLVVYAVLFVAGGKRHGRSATPSALSLWYARWIRDRADALVRHSSRFNVPLTEAMQRFASEWASRAPDSTPRQTRVSPRCRHRGPRLGRRPVPPRPSVALRSGLGEHVPASEPSALGVQLVVRACCGAQRHHAADDRASRSDALERG